MEKDIFRKKIRLKILQINGTFKKIKRKKTEKKNKTKNIFIERK